MIVKDRVLFDLLHFFNYYSIIIEALETLGLQYSLHYSLVQFQMALSFFLLFIIIAFLFFYSL